MTLPERVSAGQLVALAAFVLVASGAERACAQIAGGEALTEGQVREARGDPEGAFEAYVRALEADPPVAAAAKGIARTSRTLGRTAEASQLLRRAAERASKDVALRLGVGTALLQLGDEAGARGEFSVAIHLLGGTPPAYMQVAARYLSAGDFQGALDTYAAGRRASGRPALFAREMARIYETMGEPLKSLDESLRLATSGPKQLARLRPNLLAFFRAADDPGPLLDRLKRAYETDPAATGLGHLLADALATTGRAEEAVELYAEIAQADGSGGATLFNFARRMERQGHPVAARRAFAAFVERFPTSPALPVALLAVARDELGAGRTEAALSLFLDIVMRYPKRLEAARALLAAGEVQLGAKENPIRALEHFGAVTARRDWALVWPKAYRRTAEAHVRLGQLDEAARAYRKYAAVAPGPDVTRDALLAIARLHFWGGDVEAVKEAVDAAVDWPSDDPRLNDLLTLVSFVEEHADAPGALAAYAHADLARAQGEPEQALAELAGAWESLAGSSLADDALFLAAECRIDASHYESACGRWEALIAEHPASTLAPRARIALAETYEVHLGDMARAIAIYEAFLEEHPEDVEVQRVRRHLRALLKEGSALPSRGKKQG